MEEVVDWAAMWLIATLPPYSIWTKSMAGSRCGLGHILVDELKWHNFDKLEDSTGDTWQIIESASKNLTWDSQLNGLPG